MSWHPLTVADREGTLRRVRCACQREVWSDVMVDATALGLGDLCDGCWSTLTYRPTERADILGALGAPAHEVARHRAKPDTIGRPRGRGGRDG